MNAASVDVKDMLAAESALALTFATDLFIGMEPASPDATVTIFDTMGSQPQLCLDDAEYEYPSLQIRVRGNDYVTAYTLAQQIVDTLHGRANESWNSATYTVIYCVNGPTFLDYDKSNRVRFVINFNLQRKE